MKHIFEGLINVFLTYTFCIAIAIIVINFGCADLLEHKAMVIPIALILWIGICILSNQITKIMVKKGYL